MAHSIAFSGRASAKIVVPPRSPPPSEEKHEEQVRELFVAPKEQWLVRNRGTSEVIAIIKTSSLGWPRPAGFEATVAEHG